MALTNGTNTTKTRFYAVNLRTGNVEHESTDRAEVLRFADNAALLFGQRFAIVGPGESLA